MGNEAHLVKGALEGCRAEQRRSRPPPPPCHGLGAQAFYVDECLLLSSLMRALWRKILITVYIRVKVYFVRRLMFGQAGPAA